MAKIMVVDDAAFMRMRCSKLLAENGHDVTEASNGLEAVKKYSESRPDGVLLDITMPEMDGIATLKKLVEIDPAARVVMVPAVPTSTVGGHRSAPIMLSDSVKAVRATSQHRAISSASGGS